MNSKKKVLVIEVIGIVLIIILGFLFHQLYELSGKNFIVGLISPVNESKWEHWKIAFWPMFIIGILEYFLISNKVNNFIFSKAIAIIIFEIVTFGLIELYEVFFGEGEMLLHISTYILGAIIGQIIGYFVMSKTKASIKLERIGVLILVIQIFFLVAFTLKPPKIGYFKNSLDGTFGIYKETKY